LPFILRRNNLVGPSPCNRLDPLWLTWDGYREEDIGRIITSYFKRKLGLHITTTAIRSLVATESQVHLDCGTITLAEKEAIGNISGHSSQIITAHYLLNDRVNDIHKSRKLFASLREKFGIKIGNESGEIGDHIVAYDWPDVVKPTYIDWGTDHPDYQSKGRRARWSRAELNYIYMWHNRFIAGRDNEKTNIVALLYRYITTGAGHREAQPIFHVNHVLDSGRLRHGYRIVNGDRPSGLNIDCDI
jgi:hypothetical protein